MGRLLGGEHDSTPQSGMEAPRLLKRSLPRLYYCCMLYVVCCMLYVVCCMLYVVHSDPFLQPPCNCFAHVSVLQHRFVLMCFSPRLRQQEVVLRFRFHTTPLLFDCSVSFRLAIGFCTGSVRVATIMPLTLRRLITGFLPSQSKSRFPVHQAGVVRSIALQLRSNLGCC